VKKFPWFGMTFLALVSGLVLGAAVNVTVGVIAAAIVVASVLVDHFQWSRGSVLLTGVAMLLLLAAGVYQLTIGGRPGLGLIWLLIFALLLAIELYCAYGPEEKGTSAER
jgi:hypothetical protein